MTNKLPEHFENPFDVYIYKTIGKLNPILYKNGFSPNMITTISFIFGLLSIYYFTQKKFIHSSILFFCSYYFDCVDGSFARKYDMVTIFGDWYDHLTDYLIIIGLFIVIYNNDNIPDYFKYFGLGFLSLLLIGMFIHVSHQEIYYSKYRRASETSMLHDYIGAVFKAVEPDNMIYTRYFGCGSWNILMSLFILLNKYITK